MNEAPPDLPVPRWRPGLKVFAFLLRAPVHLRWALEPATLGYSSKELVSPRGDRIPFRMKSKVEIANNVMRRAAIDGLPIKP